MTRSTPIHILCDAIVRTKGLGRKNGVMGKHKEGFTARTAI